MPRRRNLNPEFLRRLMQQDEIRGLAVVFLTGEQFGVSDENPSIDEYVTIRTGPGSTLAGIDNYKGWSVPGKLYCIRCWSPLLGVPREVIQRNWCESCNAPLYEHDDAKLDQLGFDIYREHVFRYTRLATRKFRGLISPTGKLSPRGAPAAGCHIDHIYSVRDAFENDVCESVVSAPPNLRVLTSKKNLAKNRKSGISLDGMRARYDLFVAEHPEWHQLVAESYERVETFVFGA